MTKKKNKKGFYILQWFFNGKFHYKAIDDFFPISK